MAKKPENEPEKRVEKATGEPAIYKEAQELMLKHKVKHGIMIVAVEADPEATGPNNPLLILKGDEIEAAKLAAVFIRFIKGKLNDSLSTEIRPPAPEAGGPL